MEIHFSPKAQEDIRRFGWGRTFLLMRVLRDLRDDARLIDRLQQLPSPPGTRRFRIDLTKTFVARVSVAGDGLLVERVVTQRELTDTGNDFFS